MLGLSLIEVSGAFGSFSLDHVVFAAVKVPGGIGGGLVGLVVLGAVAVINHILFENDGPRIDENQTPKKPAPRTPAVSSETLLRSLKTNELLHQDADITVFAPAKARPLDEIFVQVIVHLPERETEARERALKVDRDAQQLASVPLPIQLQTGDQLRITLECRDATVPEPIQCIGWNGRLVCVHFLLCTPRFQQTNEAIRPKVRIFVNGIPAGSVLFKIEIVPFVQRPPPTPASESVQRFRKPFLSYASEDRASVLRAAQLLSALKMDYFQDILNLSPGERWERKIYSEIENCDVFLLFWSRHAMESKWVIKELEFALACRKGASDANQAPEIVPILLEGPPAPHPPESLRDIHFNDPLRHIIFAEEAIARGAYHTQIASTSPKLDVKRALFSSILVSCCICALVLGGIFIWNGIVEGGADGAIESLVGFLLSILAFVLCVRIYSRHLQKKNS